MSNQPKIKSTQQIMTVLDRGVSRQTVSICGIPPQMATAILRDVQPEGQQITMELLSDPGSLLITEVAIHRDPAHSNTQIIVKLDVIEVKASITDRILAVLP